MRLRDAFVAALLGAATVVPAAMSSPDAAAAGSAGPPRRDYPAAVTGPADRGLTGWSPVFASDFSGDSLPSECGLHDGPHDAPAASYYRPDEVTVADGMLRLSMHRRDFGGRPYTTGGIACRALIQRYGRYEFRAKAPRGSGIDASATLWPSSGVAADATAVELLAAPGAERVVVSNRSAAGNTAKVVPAQVAEFHTYLIEWAPTGIGIWIDDQLAFADGRISTAPRWLSFAVSSGNALAGLPDSATVLPVEFQIDFLRVWAYDPGGAEAGPSGSAGAGGRGGGGPSGAGAPPARAAAPGLRSTLVGHSPWITAGLLPAAGAAAAVLVLRRRRPRRPPSAHRA
ncbi:MAG TPA: family 16 glycosylhydrolase [Micromonosporaceae bacterium]|nr:family 16 glycosylhydrolase [Micromonosporaceae bacterium]